MNWANRLTVSRLVLTILFVAALNSSWVYGRTSALIFFLLAEVTDFFDGEIARRYGSVTNFGELMDPLVDKIMIAAAFISLVPLKAIPAWAARLSPSPEARRPPEPWELKSPATSSSPFSYPLFMPRWLDHCSFMPSASSARRSTGCTWSCLLSPCSMSGVLVRSPARRALCQSWMGISPPPVATSSRRQGCTE